MIGRLLSGLCHRVLINAEIGNPHYKFEIKNKIKEKLLELYKKYRPDYEVMKLFLNDEFFYQFSVENLSQDCLERIRKDLHARKDASSFKVFGHPVQRIQADIARELMLLDAFPYLAEALEFLYDATNKVTLLRAILLNENFFFQINELCEQMRDLPLGEKRTVALTSFFEELNQKQAVLEELDAMPSALSESEMELSRKVFLLLESAFNQRVQERDFFSINLHKDDDPAKMLLNENQRDERRSIIDVVKKSPQHLKNQGLFAEIARQTSAIQSGRYFDSFKRGHALKRQK